MAAPDETLFSEVGNYVLENEAVHDCFFILGAEKKRIGAVKLFLINQSRAWWSMLSTESNIAEQGDIQLPDIEPEVFILLLKHCYGGLNDCSHLCDDMMLKLCYCGDKYLMTSLNEKIAHRLQPSSVDSVFAALHALVYFNLKAVEKATEEIIQTKTDEIFRHAQFLECDIESVAYIAKQERLNCEEINLFDALVVWAQHKVITNTIALRPDPLEYLLKYVRFLTISYDVLAKSKTVHTILPPSYQLQVFGRRICDPENLSESTEKRKLGFCKDWVKTFEIRHLAGSDTNRNFGMLNSSKASIRMGKKRIILKSITCKSPPNEDMDFYFAGIVYVEMIIKIVGYDSSENVCSSNVIRYKNRVKYFDNFNVPMLTADDEFVELKPNCHYIMIMVFDKEFPCWMLPSCREGHVFDHGLWFCSQSYDTHGQGLTASHITHFDYFYT